MQNVTSTLDAYLSGRKDLFSGLAIEQLETEWTQYPVLKISFGANSYEKTSALYERLNTVLSDYEEMYSVTKKSDNCSERFANIINGISKNCNF